MATTHHDHIAFIGGGNMASAIIGGLIKRGAPASSIQVVEPVAEQRATLTDKFGIDVREEPGPHLTSSTLVVWAVKPQTFKAAALQSRFHTQAALHLSVAAGIRSDSIAHWLGTEQVVRAMPNTPSAVGQGATALFTRDGDIVQGAAEALFQPVGQTIWLSDETQFDAVTAVSGSGPAYVFHFIEALAAAGEAAGLEPAMAMRLARQRWLLGVSVRM